MSPLGPSDHRTRLVAAALNWHMNSETGKAWPSQKLLATRTSLSERSVRRHISMLVKDGWLTVKATPTNRMHASRRNCYYPSLPDGLSLRADKEWPDVREDSDCPAEVFHDRPPEKHDRPKQSHERPIVGLGIISSNNQINNKGIKPLELLRQEKKQEVVQDRDRQKHVIRTYHASGQMTPEQCWDKYAKGKGWTLEEVTMLLELTQANGAAT